MRRLVTNKRCHWFIAVALSLAVFTVHAANVCNVAPSGGDISGAALSQALANGSQTLTCSADMTINDVVTWSANTLTLNAQNNININASLNGSGTSQLALQYDQGTRGGNYFVNAPVNLPAGQSFSTQQGSNGAITYSVITTLGTQADATTPPAVPNLQGMAATANLSTHYALGSNIDATLTSQWNSNGATPPVYAGYTPIGNSTNPFTGRFDGLGHIISNLTINLPNKTYVGMFGYTGTGSAISNLGLIRGNVTGSGYVGGLAGESHSNISNSYATGSITGINDSIGGLVGVNRGAISNSHAGGSVNCGSSTQDGGLVGYNEGTISNSYATVSVTGTGSKVGGLVGYNNTASISNCYAAGQVTGASSLGGLVGYNTSGTVSSYWNTTTSGQPTSAGGTGLTTAQMRTASSFTGFNFSTTWGIVEGATYPMLATYSTIITNVYQLQLMANNPGASFILGANIDASPTASGKDVWGSAGFFPVGNAAAKFTGNFDGQGYTISNLTINRPTTDYVGLFGAIGNQAGRRSVIQNIWLSGGSVSGRGYVGGLIGGASTNSGAAITISSSCATVSVSGENVVGGLIGGVSTSSGSVFTVNSSCATGSVSGGNAVGGGVGGVGAGSGSVITVSNSYATGNVTGVVNPYSSGGPIGIGGLIGGGDGSSAGAVILVGSSYAAGNVTGNQKVGGLVGEFNSAAGSRNAVMNSYATGQVTGSLTGIGGLVGMVEGVAGASHTVTNSYAIGQVAGSLTGIGGLVGMVWVRAGARHTVIRSFWDTETSKQPGSAGGFGMNTANMQMQANFTSATTANGNVNPGWDFTKVWQMSSGSYPMLQNMP